MAFYKIENPTAAFNRATNELIEVGRVALGPKATEGDVNRYNNLHAQVRFRHRDGSIGHLHLKRILFSKPLPDVFSVRVPVVVDPVSGEVTIFEKRK